MSDQIGFVTSCSPTLIKARLDGAENFQKNSAHLQVGKYLKIADGNHNYAVAIVRNINGVVEKVDSTDNWVFGFEMTPIGALIKTENSYLFRRGAQVLPVPLEPVFPLDGAQLSEFISVDGDAAFLLGNISGNPGVSYAVDGNKFLGKHVAIVGSTGSGKSSAVAYVLQRAVGFGDGEYIRGKDVNNSHIVIFDIHSEYASAFKAKSAGEEGGYSLNELNVDNLKLPYWLMSSEELESMFIESNEANSHNQVSMFKKAVTLNKKLHNKKLADVNYDTPCYFSIVEVVNYIENVNREVIGKLENEGVPKLLDGTLVDKAENFYFSKRNDFVGSSTAAANKASNGPFHGEFNRFVSRLDTILSDDRLAFITRPKKGDGTEFKTDDFEGIVRQFLGYLTKSNVSVIDLSGVPFEVLSIVVSLVSRIIFDFCFHYSKIRHSAGQLNDVPVLIVCEEAHNYVPASDAASYRSSRKSIERIAKEGRKYGVSLMVVSQRPAEVSPTIFAQCTNFVALRLTNSADQACIRGLLPDDGNGMADSLPNLAPGEALVVGDACLVPAIVQLPKPDPEPKSASVDVYKEWSATWRDPAFEALIKRWRKEQESG